MCIEYIGLYVYIFCCMYIFVYVHKTWVIITAPTVHLSRTIVHKSLNGRLECYDTTASLVYINVGYVCVSVCTIHMPYVLVFTRAMSGPSDLVN